MRPQEAAEKEGLEIIECWMPSRFDDVIFFDTIFLPTGLSGPERRWRVAHCLGHYLMHDGNQIWCQENRIRFRPKQEREADVFAACLLSCFDWEHPWTDDELWEVRWTDDNSDWPPWEHSDIPYDRCSL